MLPPCVDRIGSDYTMAGAFGCPCCLHWIESRRFGEPGRREMRKFVMLGRLLVCVAMLIAPRKAHAQTAPTFVGVRTFLSAPYEPDLDKLKADFAVLGVPFDEGTWGQPGERYGPRDMRENSQEYAHDLTEGFYYIDGDRTVLKGKHWVDVGDVTVYPTVAEETDAKITEAVKKILAKRAFPIILGGDHSITFPVVRAYDIPLRSEEHTSELQSLAYLVCRLLLEKKKKKT